MTRQTLIARLALTGLALLVAAGLALLTTTTLAPSPSAPVAGPTPAATSTPATTPVPGTSLSATPSRGSSAAIRPTDRPTPYSSAPITAAEEVAVEAARIMTTWTPSTDLDETASEPRAAHLMTPERAEKIMVSTRGTNTPQWRAAAEQNWSSVPSITVVPSDTPGRVMVNATWDWIAVDGDRTRGSTTRQFAFALTDAEDPQIRDYSWRDLR